MCSIQIWCFNVENMGLTKMILFPLVYLSLLVPYFFPQSFRQATLGLGQILIYLKKTDKYENMLYLG